MNAQLLIVTVAAIGVGFCGGYVVGAGTNKKAEPVKVKAATPSNGKRDYFIKERNNLVDDLNKLTLVSLHRSNEDLEAAFSALSVDTFEEERLKAAKNEASELVSHLRAIIIVREDMLKKSSSEDWRVKEMRDNFKNELDRITPQLLALSSRVASFDYREE